MERWVKVAKWRHVEGMEREIHVWVWGRNCGAGRNEGGKRERER